MDRTPVAGGGRVELMEFGWQIPRSTLTEHWWYFSKLLVFKKRLYQVSYCWCARNTLIFVYKVMYHNSPQTAVTIGLWCVPRGDLLAWTMQLWVGS